MDEILAEISKPSWWVTVVIAGIAINLISTFLREKIDIIFGGISNFLRNRSLKRKAEWDARIAVLSKSSYARAIARHHDVISRLHTISSLLISVLFLLLPIYMSSAGAPLPDVLRIGTLALSAMAFTLSFMSLKDSVRYNLELGAAHKLMDLRQILTSEEIEFLE